MSNTQSKEHIVAMAVLDRIETPQGAKLAAETLIWLAKSLYKAYKNSIAGISRMCPHITWRGKWELKK